MPAPSVFSEATKSLSIVVPAYNEEARLPATMDETLLCGPAAPAPQAPLRRAPGAVHSAACWLTGRPVAYAQVPAAAAG